MCTFIEPNTYIASNNSTTDDIKTFNYIVTYLCVFIILITNSLFHSVLSNLYATNFHTTRSRPHEF